MNYTAVMATTSLYLMLTTINPKGNNKENKWLSYVSQYLLTVFPNDIDNETGTNDNTDVQTGRQRPDYKKSTGFVCRGVLSPLIASFGILGNVVILVVLTRKHMVSTTNCFLTAMAVSDTLMLLVQIPADLAFIPELWRSPRFRSFSAYYFLIWNGISEIFRLTTCWLTTAVSVERYLCLRFFSYPRLVCTMKRAKIAVAVIFIVSIVFNFVKFFEYEPRLDADQTRVVVSRLGLSPIYENAVYPTDCIISIVLPIVVMVIFNTLLLHFLVTHRQKMSLVRNTNVNVDVRRVGLIVFVVVLIFLLCYSVQLLQYIDAAVRKITATSLYPDNVFFSFWPISHLLFTVNSSVNIIVYVSLNRKFLRTVKDIINECRKHAC